MTKKAHWKISPYEGPLNRHIRLLVSENPKRAGSDSETRFNQYRSGMTIKAYIDACDRLNVPNYSLSDITWDLEHRFISLFD
jgi:translation initiation factor 2 beta subunit (eIF-2beta)/eIF-5